VSEHQNERREEAPEATEETECQYCGNQSWASPYYCGQCSAFYCPFCGSSVLDECEHLLALWDDDDGFTTDPFSDCELPHLPAGIDDLWSDAQKAVAFGDLLPLLDAYIEEGGLSDEPPPFGLWSLIRDMLSVPVRSVNDFVPDSPGGSAWDDSFTEHPAEAKAEIAAIIRRLTTGFERLVVMEPAAN
jgi:hypothetical protein